MRQRLGVTAIAATVGVAGAARAQETPLTHGDQHAAASGTPVTVADLIGMTTLGSRVQGYGSEDYAVVAPDGAHVATVVKRGNLARNTMDYALLVFRTADIRRNPVPDTVPQRLWCWVLSL